MVALEDTTVGGLRMRLIDHDIAAFAIVYEQGNLAAIVKRTTDYACARIIYQRFVILAQNGGFAHPAWKAPRKVEIA